MAARPIHTQFIFSAVAVVFGSNWMAFKLYAAEFVNSGSPSLSAGPRDIKRIFCRSLLGSSDAGAFAR